ncbi:MAG: hypothetical protein HZA08_02145 [Nitrospirae bacterium]|nr:hypothetical protein [Nitrospirota bacterium]
MSTQMLSVIQTLILQKGTSRCLLRNLGIFGQSYGNYGNTVKCMGLLCLSVGILRYIVTWRYVT